MNYLLFLLVVTSSSSKENFMPTYGYKCEKCEHQFEKVQSFSDDSLKTCPKCKGSLKKLIYAPPVVFKGKGWYSTDNKKSTALTTTKEPLNKLATTKQTSKDITPTKETSKEVATTKNTIKEVTTTTKENSKNTKKNKE